jgi:uncharacterized protein YdeI (YjbR/CyaY-like superfamily)
MGTRTLNPEVDGHIAKAQPFAQPILQHLRELVHEGCPEIEETVKWGRPFFEYRGEILCNMSAFKRHCRFGFWGKEIGGVLRAAGVGIENAADSLGRITSLEELPSDKRMLDWIRQAAAFVDSGQHTSPIVARRRVVKAPKPPLAIPAKFAAAIRRNKKAATMFSGFSPTCKREYVEWVADAKRAETRDKRIATAVEWIAEGKQRNWKYQNC